MRKLKISFVVLFVLITSLCVGIISYFFLIDAPLTQGEIVYDVSYNKDQSLDIYFPTKQVYKKRPILFYIHGGAWVGGTKEAINLNRFNGAIKKLRALGYVVISPTYTLAEFGKSPFPKNISDCYEAISFVKSQAAVYHLDTNRISLLGESAGAQIAMMLAFSDPKIYGMKQAKPQFEFLIDVYGPSDLVDIYQSGLLDTIHATFSSFPNAMQNRLDLKQYLIGFKPEEDSLKAFEMMDLYSPINHLTQAFETPTLIIQGNKDRLIPLNQSENLKRSLDSLNVSNEMHILKDVDHAFLNATNAQKDSIQDWIVSFLVEKEKKK